MATPENTIEVRLVDPFDAFSDAGCAAEQLSAMIEVTTELAEDLAFAEGDLSRRAARTVFLMLSAIGRLHSVTAKQFDAVESDLYQRGIPKQVRASL